MRILFVSSGNRGISPIVKNQGTSLEAQGHNVEFFFVKGKGVFGYLSNVQRLKRFIKANKFDVVHAHYSLTAFVASLANNNSLVVSLMGSDVKKGWIYRQLIKFFAFTFIWKTIIVKSDDMKKSLKIDKSMVIPNGVDLQRFNNIERSDCRRKLGWNEKKYHILFPANIARPEKNYGLLEMALILLNDEDIEVHWFNKVPNEETPIWYNAADVIVMTSLWEGSPNAIKEAMACNQPIVSTDVGDVRWLFGDTEGCYITERDPELLAEKIKLALAFKGKTKGRQRIIDLGLSNELVAKKLVRIYEEVIKSSARVGTGAED